MTLANNDNFMRYLKEQGALLTIDDYYDMYGPFDPYPKMDKKIFVAKMNLKALKRVSKVLLEFKDEILKRTTTELANYSKLTERIKTAFGFKNVHLSEEFYKEIFYTYKYCYITAFFQNNAERFTPECDFETIQANPAASAYLDAVMKEFDKLNYILDNTYDFNSFKEIPWEYINYLTQLLGLEQKTVMAESSQEGQFRILAENVIEFYSKKGLNGTFELLFNLFGYDVILNNYYFDRRNYYLENSENLELGTSNKNDYRFYLTERDPSLNLNDNISIGEVVTLKDFSPQYNLNNFKELVDDSTLLCVLGYNTQYYDKKGEEKTYEGPVYKYFKTNYLRIRPTKRYDKSNMTTNQLYQLKAFVDFLIPEFFMRDLYVTVDIESIDSRPYDKIAWGWMFTDEHGKADFLPWDNDKENNNFVMLDSEEWNQSYGNLYIIDYDQYKETLKNRDATGIVINDYSKKKTYYNSMGMDMHFSEDSWRNVFFNPVSEKIKYINSTQYWGDKVKTVNLKSTDDLYEVWRRDLNYNDGITHKPAPWIKGTSTLSNLSLPKDYKFLTKRDKKKWTELQTVELYGYVGNTLRKTISNMGNKKPIDKVGISLAEILNPEEEELRAEAVSNTTWMPVTKVEGGEVAELVLQENEIEQYAKYHDNIINYDYLNKEVLYAEEFNTLGATLDADGNIYSYGSSHLKMITRKNINKIVRRMGIEGSSYIVKKDDGYHIMKNVFVRKNEETDINAIRFIPSSKAKKVLYTEPTYKDLLDKIDGNIYHPDGGNDVPITSSLFIRVEADESIPYKPFVLTTDKNRINGEEYTISKIERNEIGSFFLNNAFDNDEASYSEEEFEAIYEARKPVLKVIRGNYFAKNETIYSDKDKKLFTITNSGCCEIIDENGKSHYLGIEEKNFRGKVSSEIENDEEKWYLYEYDEEYEGFQEKDDDDNYVFLNYDRDVGFGQIGFERDFILRPIKAFMDNFLEEGENPRIVYLFNYIGDLLSSSFTKRELNDITKILGKSISSFFYELYFTDTAPEDRINSLIEYLKKIENSTLYYKAFDYNNSDAFYKFIEYLGKRYVSRKFDVTLVNKEIAKVNYDSSFRDEIIIGATSSAFDKTYLRLYSQGDSCYVQAMMNGAEIKNMPLSEFSKSNLFLYYCYNKAYPGINNKGDTHLFYKFVNGFQVAPDYVYEHFRSYLMELCLLYLQGKENFQQSLKTYFYREIVSRYRTRKFDETFFLSFGMSENNVIRKYEKLNGVGCNLGEATTLMPSRYVFNSSNKENIYIFNKSTFDGEKLKLYIPQDAFDNNLKKLLTNVDNINMIKEVLFPIKPTFYCNVTLTTDEEKANYRKIINHFNKELFYDDNYISRLTISSTIIDGINYFVLGIKSGELSADNMEIGSGHITVRRLKQQLGSNFVSNAVQSPIISRDINANAIEFNSLLDDREFSVTTYDYQLMADEEGEMDYFDTSIEYNNKQFWIDCSELAHYYNVDTINSIVIKDEASTYVCNVDKILTMEPEPDVATSSFLYKDGNLVTALAVNNPTSGEFDGDYTEFKDGIFEFTGEHGIFKDSYVTDDPLHATYGKWVIIAPDREILKMKIKRSKDIKIVAFTQNDCNHNDSVIFCKKDN